MEVFGLQLLVLVFIFGNIASFCGVIHRAIEDELMPENVEFTVKHLLCLTVFLPGTLAALAILTVVLLLGLMFLIIMKVLNMKIG